MIGTWRRDGLAVALACACLALFPPRGAGAGAVFISGDDADDVSHCQGQACGDLYPTVLRLLYQECDPVPVERQGILAIGINGEPALSSFLGWVDVDNGGPGAPYTVVATQAEIAAAVFEDYRVVYIPTSSAQTPGGITPLQLAALNARALELRAYINDNNGRLLALTEAGAAGAYGWLPNPLTYVNFSTGLRDVDPTPDMAAQFPGTQTNASNMDHDAYHTIWTGPGGYSGLYVLAVSKDQQIADPSDPTRMIDGPIVLGGCSVKISAEICDNGADDDGDGQTDGDDPDCWVCGNGRTDPGEQCDDGNRIGGDGCEADCTPTPCLTLPQRLYPLLGVRAGIEARWSWPSDPRAGDGYRLYCLLPKADLDVTVAGKGARGSNPGAAVECATSEGASLSCADPDAFSPATPSLLYCQIVGVCGLTEGAN